jgi:hypothetical protein
LSPFFLVFVVPLATCIVGSARAPFSTT